MHFDSSFALGLVLLARATQGLLIPPQAASQEDNDALQHYSDLIEALHEQSGGFHERFKAAAALRFQDAAEDSQLANDNVYGDSKKGGKKGPKNGDGEDDGTIKLVPVVLGVMSKCPDAEICESVFDKTLGQVSDLVDLKTVYIGHLNSTSRPYGVNCMHGSQECDGNVQQLCVRDDPKIPQRDWWNFIQCQNFQDLKRVGDLSIAKQCAKVIGKDWDAEFSDCYTGPRGAKLLRDSVKEAQKLKIEKSCSIMINDKLVCIHDGSWKHCLIGHEPSDFAKYIKNEYDFINKKK